MQRDNQRAAEDAAHDDDDQAATLPAPGREDIRSAAERGTQGGGGALPFLAQIQRAFGRHDIGNIRAHQGGDAQRAAQSVGAHAYALGDHVVFGKTPDLHLAAHEAAHVVQQRAGRAPAGGISERDDSLERHADQVADAVVRGESAERLLDQVAPARGVGPAAPQGVQREQGLKETQKVVVNGRLGTIVKVKSKLLYTVDFGTGKPEDCLEKSVTAATEQDIERDRLLRERGTKKPVAPQQEDRHDQAPSFKVDDPVTITGTPLDVYHVHSAAKGGFMILKGGETTPFFVRTYNIHPLSEANKKTLEAMERARPRTVGDSVRCPLLGGPDTVYKVLEDKGDKLVIEHGGDRTEVERWMLVHISWTAYVPEKKKVGMHELITDELQESQKGGKSKQELGTPSFERKKVKEYDGKLIGQVSYSKVDFKDTARIDVTSSQNDDGVTISYTVLSNPEYMCVRKYPEGHEKAKTPEVKDFVPLQLETKPDEHAEMMAVVEPTSEQNCATGTVRYTWKALAQAINIPGAEAMSNGDAKAAVLDKTKELGVKAQWLASVAGKNNQNHTSGGLRQKGGSGKVFLTAVDNSDYLETEKDKRITDWNSGEKLKSSRPAFQKFSSIMAEGKELATTLEAESEFMVRPERFQMIVDKMGTLATTKEYWSHFGIHKMTKSDPKQYTDTYYDIAGSEGHDNELLKKGIVLRERHVATDPKDTFLFAVKGASKQKKDTEESIRLAAQVNLDRDKVQGNSGELDKLVQDTSIDNPFGRTLDHALSGGTEVDHGGTRMKSLMGERGHIKPALQIQSTRYKFLMELEGGTAIDFSADRAEGKQIKDGKVVEPESSAKPPVVHSFEFGVGHPNLTASATPSTGNGQQQTVERPYHVPQDVDNPELFEKTDYKQFQTLRDGVMKEALLEKGEKLQKGGNKAQVLAKALGMIPG